MPCPFHFKNRDSTEPSLPPSPSLWMRAKAAAQLLGRRKLEDVLGPAFEKYGCIIHTKGLLLMKGPEALRFLFTADPAFIQRGPIAEEGPVSLASMDGQQHTRHRHFVLQTFQRKWLLKYAEKTKNEVIAQVSVWPNVIDIEQKMMDLASKIILTTLLDLSSQSSYFNDFIRDYTLVSNRGRKSESSRSSYQKAMAAQPKLWSLLEKLLKERMDKPSSDILTAFIEAKKDFYDITDTDTLNYLYMLSEFGQEDLGSILTFSLAILANRIELKKNLLEDLTPFDVDSFDVEKISNLSSMQNFIREVERLYPPVSFILRSAVADYHFNDYKIPKGYRLLGSIFHTHRDPALFTNPLHFNPERFEAGEKFNFATKAVLGFGGGFHMCPAKQFVYMQVSLILFFLLKTCEFSHSHIVPEIQYNPKAGLQKKISLTVKVLPGKSYKWLI